MTDEERIRAAWDICQWTPKYDGDTWKALPADYFHAPFRADAEYDEKAQDPVIVFRRVDGTKGHQRWVRIYGRLGGTEIVVDEAPYVR